MSSMAGRLEDARSCSRARGADLLSHVLRDSRQRAVTDGNPLTLIPLPLTVEPPVTEVPTANAVIGGESSQQADPAPVRPAEPDAADCCGEGCVRCVYDRYDAAVERYQLALGEWQARHPDAR